MSKQKVDKIDKLFHDAVVRLNQVTYSPKKMVDFLIKKGASKEEAKIVLEKLTRYSLIDEDELIKNVISYCDTKHYGYNRIISMLINRKVSKEKISKIYKDSKRELKEAYLLHERLIKRYKNVNTLNLKRKVNNALIRYGFDENIASICVSKISISPREELNMLKLNYKKIFSSYSRKLKGNKLKDKIIKSLLSKGYHLEDIKKVMEEHKHEMD